MENPYIIRYSYVESSHTYDMLLSGLESKSYSISQSVSPNGVDRFKIKLANSYGDPETPPIYRLSILMVYNEEDLYVESKEIILPISYMQKHRGCYIADTVKEKAKKNYINLQRFYERDTIKSKHFLFIYNSYEENKKDFLS
ncbi:hypothetical protein [Priestia sp. FSL R5-0680]|uniref:hypothetical protein n=1 Tax=Priestia sp. FSL R5-0680 TaxID=2921582 RepID=UPI0030F81FB8